MFRLNFNHAWIGRANKPTQAEALLSATGTTLRAECSAGHLPALTMPFAEELTSSLDTFSPKLKAFKHMVVLGIGGSALGARALQKAFFPQQDRPMHTGPWLWIADNIDSDTLCAWMSSLNPSETVLLVVSKSGGTIETLSQYFIMKNWLKTSLGDSWREHTILVTDAQKGFLREEASRENIVSFPVPDFLGGRYSVLSAVGMLPAAFMGMDWKGLMRGAMSITRPLANLSDNALELHASWRFALWAYQLWTQKYSQLIFFSYIPSWGCLGAWFAQLWAESLGKNGKGTMPIPAVGVTDQHSLQQMFLDGPKDKGCLLLSCPALSENEAANPAFPSSLPREWAWLEGRRFGELLGAECLGTSAALAHCEVPLVQFEALNTQAEAFGATMGFCMAATLMTGWMMDINPVDQPAVELGKRLARARLGVEGYSEEHSMLDTFLNAKGNA